VRTRNSCAPWPRGPDPAADCPQAELGNRSDEFSIGTQTRCALRCDRAHQRLREGAHDAGGRDIPEDEAVQTATAGLTALGLDPAGLIMKVTTDAAHLARPQRLDLEKNELVDEVTDPRIG